MIRAQMTGTDEIEAEGFKVKSKSTIGALCRELKDHGFEDQAMEVFRGDKKCLIVKSIFKGAEVVVKEEPNLHYGKYDPEFKDKMEKYTDEE